MSAGNFNIFVYMSEVILSLLENLSERRHVQFYERLQRILHEHCYRIATALLVHSNVEAMQ